MIKIIKWTIAKWVCKYEKKNEKFLGKDLVIRMEGRVWSSSSIIAIAVGGILLLLLIIDFACCLTCHIGMIAALCRKTKRSPSELDEETKIGR